MKCSRQRKNTMYFFSLHLLRENDTVKSLKMAVAVTKYRYITFQVELSNLNSTRFDSLNTFFGLIRLGSGFDLWCRGHSRIMRKNSIK